MATPTVATSHQQNAHGHHPSLAMYFLVYVVLLVLTIVTYVTGKMHLGTVALPLALTIATTKAALVVAIFMHLYYTRGAPLVSLSVSIFFVIALILGVLGDLAFRFPWAVPNNVPEIQGPPIGYNMGDGPDGHYHGGKMGNPKAPEVKPQGQQ
ncbi:MAG: cytochrome C oxidase subunit IV family protein [Myxococcaceae bacterium]